MAHLETLEFANMRIEDITAMPTPRRAALAPYVRERLKEIYAMAAPGTPPCETKQDVRREVRQREMLQYNDDVRAKRRSYRDAMALAAPSIDAAIRQRVGVLHEFQLLITNTNNGRRMGVLFLTQFKVRGTTPQGAVLYSCLVTPAFNDAGRRFYAVLLQQMLTGMLRTPARIIRPRAETNGRIVGFDFPHVEIQMGQAYDDSIDTLITNLRADGLTVETYDDVANDRGFNRNSKLKSVRV